MELWSSSGFIMLLFMSVLFIVCAVNLMWKWNKTLIMILLLESLSLSLLGIILFLSTSGFLMFLAFTFFVSEALVILSSLYLSLSLTGNVMTTPVI